MSLSELLKKDMVRKTNPDKEKATKLLKISERDLKAAADNLKDENYDWALAIAYNAMLSAGNAFMAVNGYRTTSEAHHLAVVQYCAAVLPKEAAVLAHTFNRYRVRRHDAVYGEAESVGKDESIKALENAKKVVEAIRDKLS